SDCSSLRPAGYDSNRYLPLSVFPQKRDFAEIFACVKIFFLDKQGNPALIAQKIIIVEVLLLNGKEISFRLYFNSGIAPAVSLNTDFFQIIASGFLYGQFFPVTGEIHWLLFAC